MSERPTEKLRSEWRTDTESMRDQLEETSSSAGFSKPRFANGFFNSEKQDSTNEQETTKIAPYGATGSLESASDSDLLRRQTTTTTHLGGLLKFRARDDDDPSDWWFASTAIPLLSATFAPMANLLSIAALVVHWRNDVIDDTASLRYSTSIGFDDPQWCLNLNGASLACGFVGNVFLLCNFTRKIRYILALPVTILLFYIASGILIGITVAMNVYDAPKADQVYSQGFWYAIVAACLYLLNAMLLMVNMLGYFLGHYPQHFDLNDEQRNLILQTMIFFVWLGGGAAVFSKIEAGIGYVDALYFCDVTLLTIGFGDYVPSTDVARGLIFPYTVGGTIILGLMVSSIHKFARELSKEKVVKKHIEQRRINTLTRAVPLESLKAPANLDPSHIHDQISRPLEGSRIQQDLDEKAKLEKVLRRSIGFQAPLRDNTVSTMDSSFSGRQPSAAMTRRPSAGLGSTALSKVKSLTHSLVSTRSQKQILMRDEKARFDKMRDIQDAARKFKKWYALVMSVIAFGLLWCGGAVVFWEAEMNTQGLTYFQSLYFCYVSLLTIGYGDLSPKSNAGKPFFVVWSLIAVPTMTILISDLGDTVIGGFRRKVLDYGGLAFLGKGKGWGLDWFRSKTRVIQRHVAGSRFDRMPRLERDGEQQQSFQEDGSPSTIAQLADEEITEAQMIRKLAFALQKVADDMKHNPYRRYSYEEWVGFTRLIRFSKLDNDTKDSLDVSAQLEYEEAHDGVVEWDWLDENSPMTSEQSEAEWILDRLLESLLRSHCKRDAQQAVVALQGKPQNTAPNRRLFIADARARLDSTTSVTSRKSIEQNDEADKAQWSKRGQAKRHHRKTRGLHVHHRHHGTTYQGYSLKRRQMHFKHGEHGND